MVSTTAAMPSRVLIYTGALKPRIAIALSAIFNFIGPLAIGVAVAETIGGVIDASQVADRPQLIIAALLGACVWEILTWLWALPMSSSHALMGGLLGAGLGGSGYGWHLLEQGHSRLCFPV
jgi:PiT family inorganic phosphate transporter